MEADTAEQILESFTAKANESTAQPAPVQQGAAVSDEDIISTKARQGGKQSASILQKRTTIPETQLEKRIAATIRKYPDIVESKLRGDLAGQIEKNGVNSEEEDLTEEQFSDIVNRHVAKKEQEQPTPGPLLSPPPFASKTIQAVQDKVTKAADRVSALSTPGGVGIMIFALMFFIWVIIPVSNGKTRMQLLWAVLTNQAYFPDNEQGASGNFGEGGIPAGDIPNVGSGAAAFTTANLVPFVPDFEQDEY